MAQYIYLRCYLKLNEAELTFITVANNGQGNKSNEYSKRVFWTSVFTSWIAPYTVLFNTGSIRPEKILSTFRKIKVFSRGESVENKRRFCLISSSFISWLVINSSIILVFLLAGSETQENFDPCLHQNTTTFEYNENPTGLFFCKLNTAAKGFLFCHDDKNYYNYQVGCLVALFVSNIFSLLAPVVLQLLGNNFLLYHYLGIITPLLIKDLISELHLIKIEILHQAMLSLENEKEKGEVEFLETKIKKILPKADEYLLNEPDLDSGDSCMHVAYQLGFLQLLEHMKKMGDKMNAINRNQITSHLRCCQNNSDWNKQTVELTSMNCKGV